MTKTYVNEPVVVVVNIFVAVGFATVVVSDVSCWFDEVVVFEIVVVVEIVDVIVVEIGVGSNVWRFVVVSSDTALRSKESRLTVLLAV